jgi:Ni/Fe-hydrogenase subunit HybB-like protein
MTKMWRALLLVLFAAGIVAAAGKAFFWGESVTKYGAYVPWGLWIAIYISLVGAAAGCVGVGAWLTAQEKDDSGPAMPAALLAGAVCLAFGLAFVGIDLGKPLQGIRIFLQPSFSSALAWASWLYVAFFVCVAGYFLTKVRRPLMWLAVLCAVGFTVAEGLFFGQMVARPLWNSAITTVLFLVAAVASGSALLLLGWSTVGLNVPAALLTKLRKFLLWAILAYAAVELVDVAMAMGGDPAKAMAAKRMAASYGFWLLFGIIGTLAPLLLLWKTERGILAAVLVLVGAVGSKYAFVRYGFWPEPMPGIVQAFQDTSLQTRYFPSTVEWVVGVGLLAGAVWVTLWAIEKFIMPKTAQ